MPAPTTDPVERERNLSLYGDDRTRVPLPSKTPFKPMAGWDDSLEVTLTPVSYPEPEPEPEADTTWYGQSYGSLVRGFSGGFADLFKAGGVLSYNINRNLPDFLSSGDKPQESAFWWIGEQIDWLGDAVTPTESRQYGDSFLASTVPGALGSGASFLVGGGLGRAAVTKYVGKEALQELPKAGGRIMGKRAIAKGATMKEAGKKAAKGRAYGEMVIPSAVIAAQGSAVGLTAGYEDARNTFLQKSGRTDLTAEEETEAFKSALWNGGMGLSEAVPLASMLTRINRNTGGGISRALKIAAVEGVEEMGQELAQSAWGNLFAAEILKYDEGRKISAGLVESAGAGGISGVILSLVTSAVGGKMRRGRDAFQTKEQATKARENGLEETATARSRNWRHRPFRQLPSTEHGWLC